MWFKITTCLLDVQAASFSPFLLKCTSKIPPSALNVFFNDPSYKTGLINHFSLSYFTFVSQTFNTSSKLPEANRRASGLKEIEYTASVWLFKT